MTIFEPVSDVQSIILWCIPKQDLIYQHRGDIVTKPDVIEYSHK